MSPQPSMIWLSGAVLLAILLAALTYHFIERPIRARTRQRSVVAILLFVVLLVGFLGYNAYSRAGLQFRAIAKATDLPVYDWSNGYRYGRCFLSGEAGHPIVFAAECDGGDDLSRPLIGLWGDSHAASLYPGVSTLAEERRYRVAQYVTSGCPPVLDFAIANRPECVGINKDAFDRLVALRPAIVLLAGHWSIYDGKGGWSLLDDVLLETTISRLQAAGIGQIVLVGHLPTFKGGKPSIARNFFVAGKNDRTKVGFNDWIVPHDQRIRQLAGRSGVGYFSPLELLCNEQGCLISAAPDQFLPMAWDSSHLTDHGSRLLIDKAMAGGAFSLPDSRVSADGSRQ